MKKRQKSHVYPDSFKIVQLPLLPDHQEYLAGVVVTDKDVVACMSELVEAGYQVSVQVNYGFDNYSCAVKGVEEKSNNYGNVMYSNAPTPAMAVAVAHYKVFTVAGGMTWETSNPPQRSAFS